jgi:hypothetical protein
VAEARAAAVARPAGAEGGLAPARRAGTGVSPVLDDRPARESRGRRRLGLAGARLRPRPGPAVSPREAPAAAGRERERRQLIRRRREEAAPADRRRRLVRGRQAAGAHGVQPTAQPAMTGGGRAGGRAGTDARASFRSPRLGSSIDLSQPGRHALHKWRRRLVSLVMPAASHLSVRDFFLMPSYVVVVVHVPHTSIPSSSFLHVHTI